MKPEMIRDPNEFESNQNDLKVQARQDLPIPNWHKEILEKRLREDREDKITYIPWEQAKAKLKRNLSEI